MKHFVLTSLLITSLILSIWPSSPAFATSAEPKSVILDVRTPAEYADNHLKESVNLDFHSPDFEAKLKTLNKELPYKLYCRSGNRSGQAERLMRSLGFKSIENLGSLQEAAKKLKKDCAIRPNC